MQYIMMLSMPKQKFTIKQEDIILGRKIHALRIEKDLNIKECSKRINVTAQQLERYEAGTDFVPLDVLERIEEKLDIYLPKKTLRKISKLRNHHERDEDTIEQLCVLYENIW